MKTNEGLGNLHVSEEQIMGTIGALIEACERHNDRQYLDHMFMSLGILYGYDPQEFFDRLAISTLKVADETGHKNDPLVAMLRDEMAGNGSVLAGEPVNLLDLL
jgi:hypothetical protein